MKYAKLISISLLFFSSALPSSRITVSDMTEIAVQTEYSTVSYVQHTDIDALIESLNNRKVTASPMRAVVLAKVESVDNNLSIDAWRSTCCLDEMDK